MDLNWDLVELPAVVAFRDLYRREMNCQIVHDSWSARFKTSCYRASVGGSTAGYGLVDRQHHMDTLYEYYLLPDARRRALPLFRQLLTVSHAKSIRAQTNDRLLMLMLYDCAAQVTSDTILFADATTTHHACPGATFRKVAGAEKPGVFDHHSEPVGDWGLEVDGTIVATGGALYHYNPPYGDVYMEVSEPARRKGYGSYLVQEVKRATYEAGKVPAARCNASNTASRRALERAGFLPCGRVLDGAVT